MARAVGALERAHGAADLAKRGREIAGLVRCDRGLEPLHTDHLRHRSESALPRQPYATTATPPGARTSPSGPALRALAWSYSWQSCHETLSRTQRAIWGSSSFDLRTPTKRYI